MLLTEHSPASVSELAEHAGRIFQQAFYNSSDSQLTGLNEVLQQIFQNPPSLCPNQYGEALSAG